MRLIRRALDRGDLVRRLREQAQAGSHRWVDVMMLLLEAANELEKPMTAYEALKELIAAIDARWEGESDRKRSNAISPRMEEALTAARKVLAEQDSDKYPHGS